MFKGSAIVRACVLFCGIIVMTACGGGGSDNASPPPASPSTSPGTIALSANSVSVGQATGSVAVQVTRSGNSSGTVDVQYATSNGSASAGTHYTATNGSLSWADGDAAAKTINIPISTAASFQGERTFTLSLSNVVGGATLGSPRSTAVTISGSGASSSALGFSSASFSVSQTSATVVVSVIRTGDSGTSTSVQYATANGSAVAGSDYTAKNGTLTWTAGDSAGKSIEIQIANVASFAGEKTFTVTLSNPSGSTLATSRTTVAIRGADCSRNSNSWVTTGIFDSKRFGNYVVNNNNWGGTPNQQLWANSESCWGVTTNATTERYSIGSYPSVTRGWSQNASIMQELSTPGTNDWTTKSGMGIPVGQLTKAKARWAFTAPSAPSARWLGLMDVYLHKKNNPSPSEFPPFVDLMIDQALADQPVNDTTYYALVAGNANATTVTLGGVTYLVYIDDPGEAIYHQSGGHTIHLFATPTDVTHKNGPNWGTRNGTTDVAAIVKYFMQSNPKDDAGRPLKNAAGAVITSPLITSDLYLNSINAGWEIDFGTSFTNTQFCVALQSEPDCA